MVGDERDSPLIRVMGLDEFDVEAVRSRGMLQIEPVHTWRDGIKAGIVVRSVERVVFGDGVYKGWNGMAVPKR